MRAVGLKVLKNKLSEYVRLAASGETVLVTDRDRVVAELVPPSEGRSPRLADAVLAEAMRRGWLTAPTLVTKDPPPRAPVARLEELMAELERDREDRFPAPVRTLDALHLASLEFLRAQGQEVALASYDERMRSAARAMGIPVAAL